MHVVRGCAVAGVSHSLGPYAYLNQMLYTIWIKYYAGPGGANQIRDYYNAFTPKIERNIRDYSLLNSDHNDNT